MPPQMVMEQIRDFFEVKTLAQDVKEIPADVDVLMVAQPDRLTPEAAYAIDQYVLGGGKVLAFVDPVAEMSARAGPDGHAAAAARAPEFIKLLKAWGVDFDPSKVVGDIANARRVQFGGGAPPDRDGVRGLARRSTAAASTRRTCCRAASSGSTSPRPASCRRPRAPRRR